MLLFKKRFHSGLLDHTVTLTFRRWKRVLVKPGVRYRCHPLGVLLVDSVTTQPVDDITEEDAKRAGFVDRAELIAYLEEGLGGPLQPAETVFRVALHHVGDEDAKPIAFEDGMSAEEIEQVRARLAKLDGNAPWTMQTLSLIEAHPHRRAGDLAEMLGRERLEFKTDVRKLKALGLTISHEVGYSLSPRGKTFVDALRPTKKRPRQRRSPRSSAPSE